MHICYIDEAGCPGYLPANNTEIQPVLIIAGLALPKEALDSIGRQFIKIKQQYLYGESRPNSRHEDALNELKGAELRRAIREGIKAEADKAHKLAHQLLETLIAHGAELYGQVIIKVTDDKFNGTRLYAEAMMRIAKNYHQLLDKELSNGLIVADFRGSEINGKVAQPISLAMWEQKNTFPRFELPPTFGNSNSHVGLQIADIIISTLLMPLALAKFYEQIPESKHKRSDDLQHFKRYQKRLKALCRNGSSLVAVQSNYPDIAIKFL
ncbi:DUF3800 domain-containing protein [Chitinibacter fontanus]|uniref:DUF3800 domain-containing protein n=1 Tax=Chitinibacter fontanus TaxID=1737446 RepID=UPI001D13386B|nr:DUF3800 domain-containing protein [Chitinibacter fontanus]